MPLSIISAFIPLFIGVIVVALLSGALLKLLTKTLTFKQGFWISLQAYGAGTVLFFAYYLVKPVFNWPSAVDGITTLIWACVVGTIITRQSRSYGVEKTGKIGVGAKVVASIFIAAWVLVGVSYVVWVRA